jgi:hypothetical protein
MSNDKRKPSDSSQPVSTQDDSRHTRLNESTDFSEGKDLTNFVRPVIPVNSAPPNPTKPDQSDTTGDK